MEGQEPMRRVCTVTDKPQMSCGGSAPMIVSNPMAPRAGVPTAQGVGVTSDFRKRVIMARLYSVLKARSSKVHAGPWQHLYDKTYLLPPFVENLLDTWIYFAYTGISESCFCPDPHGSYPQPDCGKEFPLSRQSVERGGDHDCGAYCDRGDHFCRTQVHYCRRAGKRGRDQAGADDAVLDHYRDCRGCRVIRACRGRNQLFRGDRRSACVLIGNMLYIGSSISY